MNDIIISVFIVLGSLWILIAAIGLLRFKDLYSRVHAATKATSLGVLLITLGVIFYFDYWDVRLKSILIILFIYLTSPLAAHSIAKSFRDNSGFKGT
ncbi:monovalent cation/H(+) antiporter subunit G [Saccharicrinis aurantiacus]|uniref:monovalent cation/H(+) antiporter subunit G n=1 Tax=Saccharicrinis aurantiacus TaxID=1849719 RepID=UPI00094F5D03|nr:monovalent cation/H(+) antiporter subunit G [Saccharicrinis aurantiacus]